MQRFLIPLFCALLYLPLSVSAQTYLATYTQDGGNPGGVSGASDSETSGWTSVLTGSTLTTNVYSDTVGIPFPFEFFGMPVTHFRAAPNGILTFDTAATAPPAIDEPLPSASLPDMTICAYWDSFATVSSSDVIRWKVFGTAPNRQLWLKWHSMTISEASFVYMAAVLEEGTNTIHIVDMWSSGASTTATVGLQSNNTTSVSAAPNQILSNNGSGNSDNDYWTFFQPAVGIDINVIDVSVSDNAQLGCGSAAEAVTVTAINQGTLPASGLVGTFSVDGAVPTFLENIPGTYNTGDTISITFSLGFADLSAPGPHTITAAITSALDVDNSNDSLTITVTTVPSVAVPLPTVDFTGFTGSNLSTAFPGWFEANGVGTPIPGNSSWLRDSWINDASQPNGDAARMNIFSTGRSEWMISPKFVPVNGTLFEFDLALTDFNNGNPENFGSDDTLAILISTDCGATYTPLETFTVATPISNTGQAQSYDMAPYIGQEVIVAFYASSGTVSDPEDFDVFIDNINIFVPTGLDVGVTTLEVPASACNIDIDSVITVGVTNLETDPIDFTVNPVEVAVAITGAGTQTLLDTLDMGTLASGDTTFLTFTGDFSVAGLYDVQAYTILMGDQQNGNDSLTSPMGVASQPLYTIPYTEDFDAFTPGTSNSNPGALPFDWTRNTLEGHIWIPDANGTGSSNTGPSEDHTSGSGLYMYSEASDGNPGDTAILTSSCFDLSGATVPVLEFWYHMYGDDIGTLLVQVEDRMGGLTDVFSLSGQQQTDETDAWLSALVPLNAYAGDTITLRFISTYGGATTSDFAGDIAIDDVSIREPNQPDLRLASITAPSTPGCLTDMESVSLQLVNVGAPLDFSNDSLFLFANLSGANVQSLTGLVTTGTLPTFDTLDVTLTGTFDMSASGEYLISAAIALQGDTFPENDSAEAGPFVRIGTVALPLGPVDFDGYNSTNLATLFPGWYEGEGFPTPDTTVTSSFAVSWVRDDFANNTNSPNGDAAKINLFSTGKNEWIVAPPIVADSVTALTYDLAVTDFADQLPGDFGSDDALMVMVSTDCGASWTPERVYDATTSVSFIGQSEKVLLNGYAGQEIIVAFYATEGTVNDPEDIDVFLDNIEITQLNAEDVQPLSINLGIPPFCGDSMDVLDIVLTNNGVNDQDSLPVTVMIDGPNGMLTLTDTLFASLACDDTDTLTVGTFNSYAGGSFDFTVITGLSSDEIAANDTVTGTFFIRSVAPPTFAMPSAICEGDSLTLMATDTLYADTDFEWYDVSGTPLGTGMSFNTGPINGATTFFLGRISTVVGGCPSFLSQIEINPDPLVVAAFSVDSTADLFIAVSDSSENADSTFYIWGDGSESSDATHQYAAAGTYEVCQVALGDCGPDTTCQQVMIMCVPAAGGFAVDSTGDLFVALSNTATKADSVKYFFGDGDSSTMPNPMHMYADTGSYVVTQIAYHFCGNDTLTETVQIGCAFAVAGFTFAIDDTVVTFTSTAQNADSVVYSFGDGTVVTATGTETTYTYSQSGAYTVCMTVYNICGEDQVCQDVNDIVGGIVGSIQPTSLRLYPNPTQGSFRLDATVLERSDVNIRITDLRGRVVYQASLSQQMGELSEAITLAGVSKGLYMVHVQAGAQVLTRKLQLN